jgi:hypothetical protein
MFDTKKSHISTVVTSENLSFFLRKKIFFHLVGPVEQVAVIFAEETPTFFELERHGVILLTDWSGSKITNLPKFLFWIDQTHFHFLASQEGTPGLNHPDSRPGHYQSELWKYDVAEFFLLSSDKNRYLEFNLAPNGGWWSSAFCTPLIPAPGEPLPIPNVQTSAEVNRDGWRARASIPLSWLQKNYGFSKSTCLNACFILNSPDQIFVSAGNLGDGNPDYHRPKQFPPLDPITLA